MRFRTAQHLISKHMIEQVEMLLFMTVYNSSLSPLEIQGGSNYQGHSQLFKERSVERKLFPALYTTGTHLTLFNFI